MKNLLKIGVLVCLMSGLMGAEAFAQVKSPPFNPNAHPGGFGNLNFNSIGFGHSGYGYGGYGGYGYGGYRNPYNPLSPYSPYNPLSPYSPYNPISPVSPYYSPFNAPYYSAAYLYNPIYNPGLLSRNPAVQMNAWGYANVASTNLNSYANYYGAALQNQQAATNNYYAQVYQQQAMTQYANIANLSTQLAYQALATQQYKAGLQDPYQQQPRPSPGPAPAPPPQAPQKSHSGFSGNASNSYDSFLNGGVSPSYGSADYARPTGFDMKVAPPSYTQVQLNIAADRLNRIQKVSSTGEIIAGFAQNVLMDDVRRFPGLQAAMPALMLPEETLREINVIKNGGNLGVIRNDGKITWPVALAYVLLPVEQKKLEETTIKAIQSAMREKVDADSLISMSKQIDDIRAKLGKKVNDIPTNDYLEAKRYLNDLEDARIGLQKGEWTNHMEYQKFIAKGKSIQELAKFMVDKGLKFAPATGVDEGSYRALYSALVAYDLQLNTQFTQVAKE